MASSSLLYFLSSSVCKYVKEHNAFPCLVGKKFLPLLPANLGFGWKRGLRLNCDAKITSFDDTNKRMNRNVTSFDVI